MGKWFWQFRPFLSMIMLFSLKRKWDVWIFVTILYGLFLHSSKVSDLLDIRDHFHRSCPHLVFRTYNCEKRMLIPMQNLLSQIDQTMFGMLSLVCRHFENFMLERIFILIKNLILISYKWHVSSFLATLRMRDLPRVLVFIESKILFFRTFWYPTRR